MFNVQMTLDESIEVVYSIDKQSDYLESCLDEEVAQPVRDMEYTDDLIRGIHGLYRVRERIIQAREGVK